MVASPLMVWAQIPSASPAGKPISTSSSRSTKTPDGNARALPKKDHLETKWPGSGDADEMPAPPTAAQAKALKLFEETKELIRQRKLELALPLLAEADKLYPKRYEIATLLGIALAMLHRPGDAMAAFQNAVKLNLKSAGAHYNLCQVFMAAGKRVEATAECQEAVKLEPHRLPFRTALAGLYIFDDRTDDALRLLEDVAASSQNDLIYLGMLGDAYFMSAEYPRAAELYEKIAQKWPSVSAVYLRLSDVYDYMDRPNDAIGSARRFSELEPKLALSFLNLGEKLNASGFFDESVEALQKAIEIDPKCGDAYLTLSDNYEVLGDQQSELASLRNAYKFLPHTLPLALRLGIALSDEGNSAEAIEPLELANKLQPDFPDVMRPLGLAYIEVSRFDEGVEMIERANQISPLPSNMRIDLSSIKKRKEYIDRFDELQELVKKDPKSVQAHLDLATAYRYKGMPQENEKQYLEAVRLAGNYQAYNGLSIYYLEKQQYEKALAANSKAIELFSHHVLYLSRSNILLKLGRLDEAIDAAKKAVEIKPDSLDVRLWLGNLLLKKGDRNGALREYQTGFALAPGDARPNFKLAWLYLRMGDKNGALQHYGILKGIAPNYLTFLERALHAHFGNLP